MIGYAYVIVSCDISINTGVACIMTSDNKGRHSLHSSEYDDRTNTLEITSSLIRSHNKLTTALVRSSLIPYPNDVHHDRRARRCLL